MCPQPTNPTVRGRVRLLLARCSAVYSGRLNATLAEGLRLLIVKPDGSVGIHSGTGYRPTNWMTAPCVLTVRRPPDTPRKNLVEQWSVTNRAGEELLIDLYEIVDELAGEVDIDPGLALEGVEKDLQVALAARPDLLEPGLVLVERERAMPVGVVDLLCRDVAGRAVAVEIKRIGEIAGVEQLSRYVSQLDEDPRLAPVRGMYVACQITPQARALAEARGFDCVLVPLDRVREDPGRYELRLFDD